MSKQFVIDDSARSGLDDQDNKILKRKYVSKTTFAKILKYTDRKTKKKLPYPCEVYEIPYHHPITRKYTGYTRYRTNPIAYKEKIKAFGKTLEKKVDVSWLPKYLQKKGTGVAFYYSMLIKDWPKELKECAQVIIVEGEKKADALCKAGYVAIGIGGVNSIRSPKKLITTKDLFLDLEIEGKEIVIAFDSDILTNEHIKRAQDNFAKELVGLDADVYTGYFPEAKDGSKQGADDFIVNGGNVDDWLNNSDYVQPYAMGKAIIEMNNEYSFMLNGAKVISKITGVEYTVAEFKHVVADKKFIDVLDDNKLKPVSNAWLESPARDVIFSRDYVPQEYHLNEHSELLPFPKLIKKNHKGKQYQFYNEWTPYPVIPKKGDIAHYKTIRDYICEVEDNPEGKIASKHIDQFIAFALRGGKSHHTLIIHSTMEGNGKTLLTHMWKKCFGDNAGKLYESDLKHDAYNDWVINRQLIIGEETTERNKSDSRRITDAFKPYITDDEDIPVKMKYKARYTIDNFANFVFTSNRPVVFNLEQDDRRNFVWNPNVPVHADGVKFYQPMWDWINTDEGVEALLHYFLFEVDLSDYKPKNAPPMTQAKRVMMEMGHSELEEFIKKDVIHADYVMLAGDHYASRDLYTPQELKDAFVLNGGAESTTKTAIKNAVEKFAGRYIEKQITLKGNIKKRVCVVRNAIKWGKLPTTEFTKHYKDHERIKNLTALFTEDEASSKRGIAKATTQRNPKGKK